MRPACVTKDQIAVLFKKQTPKEIRVCPADHDLTVIIPAFNEEQRLPWTLNSLAVFLNDWAVDYRVLVADDGSTDRTAALTDGLGPRFSTLSLKNHGGKGRAVKTAMLSATGRVLAFTDADLPFDLAALRRGYEILKYGQFPSGLRCARSGRIALSSPAALDAANGDLCISSHRQNTDLAANHRYAMRAEIVYPASRAGYFFPSEYRRFCL